MAAKRGRRVGCFAPRPRDDGLEQVDRELREEDGEHARSRAPRSASLKKSGERLARVPERDVGREAREQPVDRAPTAQQHRQRDREARAPRRRAWSSGGGPPRRTVCAHRAGRAPKSRARARLGMRSAELSGRFPVRASRGGGFGVRCPATLAARSVSRQVRPAGTVFGPSGPLVRPGRRGRACGLARGTAAAPTRASATRAPWGSTETAAARSDPGWRESPSCLASWPRSRPRRCARCSARGGACRCRPARCRRRGSRSRCRRRGLAHLRRAPRRHRGPRPADRRVEIAPARCRVPSLDAHDALRRYRRQAVLLHELRQAGALHAEKRGRTRDVPPRLRQGARDAVALDLPLDVRKRSAPCADLRVGDGRRVRLDRRGAERRRRSSRRSCVVRALVARRVGPRAEAGRRHRAGTLGRRGRASCPAARGGRRRFGEGRGGDGVALGEERRGAQRVLELAHVARPAVAARAARARRRDSVFFGSPRSTAMRARRCSADARAGRRCARGAAGTSSVMPRRR